MGDKSVYAAVQQRLRPIESSLYLSAYCILKNKEDAEDAVQETIYRALEKNGQIRDWDAFRRWIAKVLIHESYKIYHNENGYCIQMIGKPFSVQPLIRVI